jgi:hypothetical protein
MKLSKNFYLNEFTKSETAVRKGIDNTPAPNIVANLLLLVTKVIQPIRDYYKLPVTINSGYRSLQLNKSIGGSIRSQHCKGEAADLEINAVDNLELAKWIRNNLTFDQLILEFYNEDNANSGWVHVSYKKGKNRKMVLQAVKKNGKTVYFEGLPL